jgi:hypothetical protein
MGEHLSVVACPFSRRDMLADLEDRVLRRLNPPLNIEGMKSDAQRGRLHSLRTSLGAAG